MNKSRASALLRQWDLKGRYVFTRRELAKLFAEDNVNTFNVGLNRLVKSGSLVRAARGVFVNPHANSFDSHVAERVAKALRPGEYNYVSLESILSEYGDISQIPIDWLTVMTTGRKGIYRTPYGTIEFIHTSRPVRDIIAQVKEVKGRPLRIASRDAALRDLKRVGRNVGMVNRQEDDDDD